MFLVKFNIIKIKSPWPEGLWAWSTTTKGGAFDDQIYITKKRKTAKQEEAKFRARL